MQYTRMFHRLAAGLEPRDGAALRGARRAASGRLRPDHAAPATATAMVMVAAT
jgi:hypothetical protein